MESLLNENSLKESLLKSKRAASPFSGPADLARHRIVCFCVFPSFEAQLEPYSEIAVREQDRLRLSFLSLRMARSEHVLGEIWQRLLSTAHNLDTASMQTLNVNT